MENCGKCEWRVSNQPFGQVWDRRGFGFFRHVVWRDDGFKVPICERTGTCSHRPYLSMENGVGVWRCNGCRARLVKGDSDFRVVPDTVPWETPQMAEREMSFSEKLMNPMELAPRRPR